MAITNGYATLAQFKQRFGLSTSDASRDADLELIIQSCSRQIEKQTGRMFYAGTAGTVRYYTAQNPYRLYLDDFTAITALVTDDDGDGTAQTIHGDNGPPPLPETADVVALVARLRSAWAGAFGGQSPPAEFVRAVGRLAAERWRATAEAEAARRS